jgi:dTDP-4-amino-4,6-dideoxygalactose transaminase
MAIHLSEATETVMFSRPFRAHGTLRNLEAVLASDHSHGDGPFTRAATDRLRELTGGGDALITTSGTHALEMASRLLGLGPGDEVIVPSFTFPSAAAAVAMTGAQIVFVDIDPATGNIDVAHARAALTPRTRAVSVLHYGGVPADLDALRALVRDSGIAMIEDNAHGLGVRTEGGHLGRFGDFGVQSFHDTKNVQCGEGGALLINDPESLLRAEIMREKGTDRSRFLRGEIDKYSWVDWGSSYLPSELNAAVLHAQLDAFGEIQAMRAEIWRHYRRSLIPWAAANGATLMDPRGEHAAHLFYLLMPTAEGRTSMLRHLNEHGIRAVFHYVPLDTSIAGEQFGRRDEPLHRSADFADRIVRLPLWAGMTAGIVDRVVETIAQWRPTD